MNTKTMEGLAGASTNMNLLNTPMRVFKEARRKGDIDTMERAMGYVGDFSEKAEEYQKKADEGIKEDAEEAREKEKLAREKAIEKRREEKRNSQEKTEESKAAKADIVEVSEEGKLLLKDAAVSGEAIAGTEESVIYTRTGVVSSSEPGSNVSVSV